MRSGSIDLIFADLPYGVTASKWDSVPELEFLWKQYKRIIKPNGVILLFATFPFAVDLINENKKMFKYSWYWEKNQGTNFFHASRMPIRKMEFILTFYKSKPAYNPQMSTGHVPTNSGKGSSPGRVYHGENKRDYEGGVTTRFPTDILKFKCVDNYSRTHPNEKPIDLCEYLICTYTSGGNLVLDNTCGTGAILVAAKKTGRKFIGIDSNFEYCKIAIERLKSI
jgi:site-specific DNA-methyltransferase (adenine-specific)